MASPATGVGRSIGAIACVSVCEYVHVFVTCSIRGWCPRCTQLGEESAPVAMTKRLLFQRRQDEHINEALANCDIARQRAGNEVQFVMNTKGCAPQLLKARGAIA